MRYKYLLTLIVLIAIHGVTVLSQDVVTPYREPYRPQYHYSAPCRWLNDPNGQVYFDGEYHLFYQFHPDSVRWGPMHWGHAVTTDLVNWETLPIALYPDEHGTIFSGRVVIDRHNTSGFGENAMVAVYSYNTQTQGIAYSNDRGRTWTKYEGNPVIPAMSKDFRDPKVFWHEETGKWIFSIAAGREIQFWESANLINWSYMSSFTTPGTTAVWEVPDLFQMEVNGETRWVLLVSLGQAPAGGSGTMYFIGDFDGQQFTTDQREFLWLDYGSDNYAGTIFSNEPENRLIHIGWMNNWLYGQDIPTSTWRGAMTLPRELSLVETPDGLRIAQTPIAALEQLRQPLSVQENLALSGTTVLDGIHGRSLEILADLDVGNARRSGIIIHHNDSSETRILYSSLVSQVLISRSSVVGDKQIPNFATAFGAPVRPINNRISLRIFVDHSSVEVFINDGVSVLTAQTFGDPSADGVAVFAEEGEASIPRLEIYGMQSIWTQDAIDAASQFPFCG
jgi:fructan beta-fructosidase